MKGLAREFRDPPIREVVRAPEYGETQAEYDERKLN